MFTLIIPISANTEPALYWKNTLQAILIRFLQENTFSAFTNEKFQ